MDILKDMDNYIELNRELFKTKRIRMFKRYSISKKIDDIIDRFFMEYKTTDILEALSIFIINKTLNNCYKSSLQCLFAIDGSEKCEVDINITAYKVYMKFYNGNFTSHGNDYIEFTYILENNTFKVIMKYNDKDYSFEIYDGNTRSISKSIKDIWFTIEEFSIKNVILTVLFDLVY